MQTLIRDHFEALEVIFEAGDEGSAAYVIEDGCVEVLKMEGAGQRRLTVLAQGAMFGEVALLDRQPRTATVRALTPTRLIRIDRDHVEELLHRSDPVIQYLLRLLLVRFRNPMGVAVETNLLAGEAGVEAPSEKSTGSEFHASAVRTLLLAQDLSSAIDAKQLELHYQPLISLSDGSPAGFEALIRWRHPALGMVSPMEFIPLAERTGLIHRIGHWVLQNALNDWPALRVFCKSNSAEPFISVNLSAPELGTQATVDAILASIAGKSIDAAQLRIELTETSIINNVDAVTSALGQLRSVGIGIALDDFGTGYAGLDYLQTLPFSCIKIDKAFVQQMRTSERSFHIVQSALALASSLGMSSVAEGIEDADIGQQLASLGCTYAQGYEYGRPMALKDIGAWASLYTPARTSSR